MRAAEPHVIFRIDDRSCIKEERQPGGADCQRGNER